MPFDWPEQNFGETPIEALLLSEADMEVPQELKGLPLENWLREIIRAEGGELKNLQYIFGSDEFLHDINVQYLNHDTYTDIITFPLTEFPLIEGEIYLSIDRIRENARTYEVPFLTELLRVMAHGVLHLLGYKDKTKAEQKEMRQKEEEALAMAPI